MDQLNRAHLLLAGSADTDQIFFENAAQAAALASNCRWAGIGLANENNPDLNIVALWDGNALGQPFELRVSGSPCEQVVNGNSDDAHIYYETEVQKEFDSCGLLSAIGAQSYRGQAFFGEDESIVGHIFAIGENSQVDSPDVRFFFDLLSQRVSSEMRRFRQQNELRRYTNMVSITRNMMSFVDHQYNHLAVSQGYVEAFGQTHESVMGTPIVDVHGDETFNTVIKPLVDRSLNGETINTRHWIYPKDQSAKYLHVWQTPYYERDGNISGVVISGHDITKEKRIEETLKSLSLAVTHSPVLTVITDPKGVIEYVSPIVETLTGYKPEEVIGKTPKLFQSGMTAKSVYDDLWKTVLSKQNWRGELQNRRKSGEIYWESISIAPVIGDEGKLIAFVAISMDISEHKRMEAQLTELATTDSLTGVLNRRHFMERVDAQLLYSERYQSIVSFLLIDIDYFKEINDQGGHALGDKAILQFSDACQNTVRNVDIFGRLGGDEFAVAMPDTSESEALILAHRLQKAVNELEINLGSNKVGMTISIGVSTYNPSENARETAQSVMARADTALYDAKRAGRDQIKTFVD